MVNQDVTGLSLKSVPPPPLPPPPLPPPPLPQFTLILPQLVKTLIEPQFLLLVIILFVVLHKRS